jgi:hypothetical protein
MSHFTEMNTVAKPTLTVVVVDVDVTVVLIYIIMQIRTSARHT